MSAVKHSSLLAVSCLVISMLCVQGSGALAKSLFASFPVLTVSAMRLLIGASLLSLCFKIWTVRWSEARWLALFSYGLSIAGMNALFYLALQRIPLGIAVAFEFIGPLSVALFHAKARLDYLWVGLAIIGLVLLFPLNDLSQPLDLLGILFALGAGACWALYILVGQRASGVSGNHTVCLGMLIGMLLLLPFLLFSPQISQAFEWHYLGYFALLAVLASAIPFSLEMVALRRLSTLTFGTLMSIEPAAAALSGMLFLGEQLLWTQWLALFTIGCASMGCTISTHHAKAKTEAK